VDSFANIGGNGGWKGNLKAGQEDVIGKTLAQSTAREESPSWCSFQNTGKRPLRFCKLSTAFAPTSDRTRHLP